MSGMAQAPGLVLSAPDTPAGDAAAMSVGPAASECRRRRGVDCDVDGKGREARKGDECAFHVWAPIDVEQAR
jgi:hypothetical protein